MAWMLKFTIENNCSRRIVWINLLLITCTLTYVLLDFNLTSMTFSKSKEQYGFDSGGRNFTGTTSGLNVSINLRLLTESVIRNVTSLPTNSNFIPVTIFATPTRLLENFTENITLNYRPQSAILNSSNSRSVSGISSLSPSFNVTIHSTVLNRPVLSALKTSSTTGKRLQHEVTVQNTKYTVTRGTNNSKLQPEMTSKTIEVQQDKSAKTQNLVHYFRCANPIGRLGNMMFQLAATIGIAHILGYKPYIAPSHDLEKYFDTGIVLDINITNEISFDDSKCRNRTWNYNKDYLSHNLTTWGYLQSWKYFENSSDAVRKTFTFRAKYLQDARAFLRLHTKPKHVLIGVHIRRGDFVSDFNTNLGYTLADGNYTRKAMNWHRKRSDKVLFVVVSDDIPWCKDNIKGKDVIFSNFTEGVLDMTILSLCHHCIITGGSFGWWSGWLAGGTVIYLDDFPRPGSWLWNNTETKQDYYHPDWIGMKNGLN